MSTEGWQLEDMKRKLRGEKGDEVGDEGGAIISHPSSFLRVVVDRFRGRVVGESRCGWRVKGIGKIHPARWGGVDLNP